MIFLSDRSDYKEIWGQGKIKFPEGIRAARILPGSNGKIAVIGRGQGNVEEFAEFLRSQGHDVETITDVPGNQEAWKEFKSSLRKRQEISGSAYRLTDEEIMGTRFYQLDKTWAIGLRQQKYTVIDTGNPLKRSPSVFLNMEYQHTFKLNGQGN